MKELVIISGKGGTGKTSLTASLAALANPVVLADCDVDASDLHLILSPRIQHREDFQAGHEAHIRQEDCIGCGACLAHCRFDAVRMQGTTAGEASFSIDPVFCEGCGVCIHFCPVKAIDFPTCICGEWYRSETRFGPMIHARLGVGAENSGKLVSLVRQKARAIAEAHKSEWLLIDGPPGISCPVIASITGASQVLVVTEPTVSGRHDLERVLTLTRHFQIPAWVCVNKWDLNPSQAESIEQFAANAGARITPRIPHDPAVTTAQIQRRTVVELGGPAANAIQELWQEVSCETQPQLETPCKN